MLPTTFDAVKSILKADVSITAVKRNTYLAALRDPPAKTEIRADTIPRLIRRAEAAQMYSCSLRLIDRLAAQGILRKVRLPGRKRGAGFLQSELLAVVAAQGQSLARLKTKPPPALIEVCGDGLKTNIAT